MAQEIIRRNRSRVEANSSQANDNERVTALSTTEGSRSGARERVWRVVLICLLVAFAVWLFVAKASPRMPDFKVYWQAGARAAAAEPLYRPSDADYQFKYFPAFAIVAIPLGVLPLDAAKAVWFTSSALALAILLRLSVGLLPYRRKPVWLLIAALLIGLGKYYAEDLVLGQINTLAALVAAFAIQALRAGREARAGALVALAIVLKPYALILAPWIVARRRLRAIAGLAVGLAVAWALPMAIYGVDGAVSLHRDWWRTVTETTEGTLLHSDNVSLASMWAKRLGIGSAAAILATASSIALVATAMVVFLRRTGVPKPDGLEAGLLLAITPLISPQGWDYVVILATPAMVYVVNDIDRLPRLLRALTIAAVAAIGLTLYDLLGRRVLYALLDFSVITIGMIVLIAALVTLRTRRLA
jgi:hypothetical protein